MSAMVELAAVNWMSLEYVISLLQPVTAPDVDPSGIRK